MALTYASDPDRASETVKAAQALGVKALAVQTDSADAKDLIPREVIAGASVVSWLGDWAWSLPVVLAAAAVALRWAPSTHSGDPT